MLSMAVLALLQIAVRLKLMLIVPVLIVILGHGVIEVTEHAVLRCGLIVMAFKAVIHLRQYLNLLELVLLVEDEVTFLTAEPLVLDVNIVIELIDLLIGEQRNVGIAILLVMTFNTALSRRYVLCPVGDNTLLDIFVTVSTGCTAVEMRLMGKGYLLTVAQGTCLGSGFIIVAFKADRHGREGTARLKGILLESFMAFCASNILHDVNLVIVYELVTGNRFYIVEALENLLVVALADTGFFLGEVNILGLLARCDSGMAFLTLYIHIQMRLVGKYRTP